MTRLYGKFANGEDSNAHDPEADDMEGEPGEVGPAADDIGAAALKLYIDPALQKGDAGERLTIASIHVAADRLATIESLKALASPK